MFIGMSNNARANVQIPHSRISNDKIHCAISWFPELRSWFQKESKYHHVECRHISNHIIQRSSSAIAKLRNANAFLDHSNRSAPAAKQAYTATRLT